MNVKNYILEQELEQLHITNEAKQELRDKINQFKNDCSKINDLPKTYDPTYTVYMYIDPEGIPYVGLAVEPSYCDCIGAIKGRAGRDGTNYKDQPIYDAFKKFGYKNFFKFGLVGGISFENAIKVEREGIKIFDSYNKGYNGNAGWNKYIKSNKLVERRLIDNPLFVEEYELRYIIYLLGSRFKAKNIVEKTHVYDGYYYAYKGVDTIEAIRECNSNKYSVIDIDQQVCVAQCKTKNELFDTIHELCSNLNWYKKAVDASLRKKRMIANKYICVDRAHLSTQEVIDICDEITKKNKVYVKAYVYLPATDEVKEYGSIEELVYDINNMYGISTHVIRSRIQGQTKNILDSSTPYFSKSSNVKNEYYEALRESHVFWCVFIDSDHRFSTVSLKDMQHRLRNEYSIDLSMDVLRAAVRSNTARPYSMLKNGNLYITKGVIKDSNSEIAHKFEPQIKYYIYNVVTKQLEFTAAYQKEIAQKLVRDDSSIRNCIRRNGSVNGCIILDHKVSEDELIEIINKSRYVIPHECIYALNLNEAKLYTYASLAEVSRAYGIDTTNASRNATNHIINRKLGLALSYDGWRSLDENDVSFVDNMEVHAIISKLYKAGQYHLVKKILA